MRRTKAVFPGQGPRAAQSCPGFLLELMACHFFFFTNVPVAGYFHGCFTFHTAPIPPAPLPFIFILVIVPTRYCPSTTVNTPHRPHPAWSAGSSFCYPRGRAGWASIWLPQTLSSYMTRTGTRRTTSRHVAVVLLWWIKREHYPCMWPWF
jgi:hypothetical protein